LAFSASNRYNGFHRRGIHAGVKTFYAFTFGVSSTKKPHCFCVPPQPDVKPAMN
jgi:hypothetical protein